MIVTSHDIFTLCSIICSLNTVEFKARDNTLLNVVSIILLLFKNNN